MKIGCVPVDSLTFDQALDEIVALCRRGDGGTVLTPNVDHVVIADKDERLRKAYEDASLSLVDGKPLVWLSRALGERLPAKISGSDLVDPLCARFSEEGLSIFLVGAAPGVGARAADNLRARHPSLHVAGVLAPPHGFDDDEDQTAAVLDVVRAARPSAVLVALGAPRQELWMQKHRRTLAPSVLIGVGGTLDFIAGKTRRAPRWISEAGLEWIFRLAQEPRRLAHRYLVRDRAFLPIALRTWRERRRMTSPTG